MWGHDASAGGPAQKSPSRGRWRPVRSEGCGAANGSVNPARTLGPYTATAILGGRVPWGQLWIYWVGPIVGALVAAFTYLIVARPESPTARTGRVPRRT